MLFRSILPPNPGTVFTTKDNTWTVAYNFDQVVSVDPCNPQRNWALTGMAGISDGNPNPCRWFLNLALMGNGPITCRPQDSVGLGYYHFGTTDQGIVDTLGFEAEDGVELYYNYAVTPWFHVTPDIQVIDPSNQRNDTTVVVGLRARISF